MVSISVELNESESKILEEMTNISLFKNKFEAMRSAIIKYAIDLVIFRKKVPAAEDRFLSKKRDDSLGKE